MYTRIKNFLQEKYKYWKVYYRKFSLERNSVWKEDTNWVGNEDSNIEIQSYFRIGRRVILKRKYKSICNSIFILENVW